MGFLVTQEQSLNALVSSVALTSTLKRTRFRELLEKDRHSGMHDQGNIGQGREVQSFQANIDFVPHLDPQ